MAKTHAKSKYIPGMGHKGDHLVLWYKTPKGRTRAISTFLGDYEKVNAFIALILPLRELQEAETQLRREGFPLDRMMEEGRLAFFASEEFLPANASDYRRLGEAMGDLRKKAKAGGMRLVLVGRVAPVLFERGEVDKAVMVEETADSSLGGARLLCLYDASVEGFVSEDDINRIDDIHTHILKEMDGGKVQTTKGRKKGTKSRREHQMDR